MSDYDAAAPKPIAKQQYSFKLNSALEYRTTGNIKVDGDFTEATANVRLGQVEGRSFGDTFKAMFSNIA